MHKYETRTYTLADEAAADRFEEVWRRHLSSFPKYGVYTHGIFRPIERRDQLVALGSVSEDVDMAKVEADIWQDVLKDLEAAGVRPDQVLGVVSVWMKPTAASPMR